MPDSNLNTSIAAMRTSILSSLPTATVADLVNLARAAKGLNLGNDSTVETAINDRALALVNGGASQAEVITISGAVKSVLSPTVLANNIANVTTINSSIIPDTDVVYDIGSTTRRFNDIYLDGSTINLGGQTIKATASGIEVPEITIGTGTNKVKLVATSTGELQQTGTDSSGNTGAPVTGSAPSSSSVAAFADLAAISGPTVGQSVLVIATNKLYIYNGSGWYMIAQVVNENPTAITGAQTTYDLATDGTATTITAISTDPEGATLSWSHAVTSGALNGTTVTNVNNVFTITPHATQAATFSLTISASDGSTGTATHVSAFTLSFILSPAETIYIGKTDNSGGETTHNFTVPAGITSISVVAIGAGGTGAQTNSSNEYSTGGGGGAMAWVNNIAVTGGEVWVVKVGNNPPRGSGSPGTGSNGGYSSITNPSGHEILKAGGGFGAIHNGSSTDGGQPSYYTTSGLTKDVDYGGGKGGSSGYANTSGNNSASGGGGASGYISNFQIFSGGNGGGAYYYAGTAPIGAYGAAWGGNASMSTGGVGGGVSPYGQGANGSGASSGGSSNTLGAAPASHGTFGFGSGGRSGSGSSSSSGRGCVRILWGQVNSANRTFPTTSVALSNSLGQTIIQS